MPEPLWTPEKTRADQSTMASFSGWMSSRTGKSFADYDALHRFSTETPGEFWSALWDFAGVLGDKGPEPYLVDEGELEKARFFPRARLNFTENVLARAGTGTALVFWGEDKLSLIHI